MRDKTFLIGWTAALAFFGVALLVTNSVAASNDFIMYSFNGSHGTLPDSGLIERSGNFYGTTNSGGAYGVGTVFELSPREGGGWTEKVLYSFKNNGRDGKSPQAALVFDAHGNLYGTTYTGGLYLGGTVFELSPEENGSWTETVLHTFGSGHDGASPCAALIFDTHGNLYGTTFGGGENQGGTVFELSLRDGSWTETVLYSFQDSDDGNPDDGSSPNGGLIFDAAGNLYGTTYTGGAYGIHQYGTVFELTPKHGGGWTEKVLHSFGSGTDGQNPSASLVFDTHGNLYGTTYAGGAYQDGTVFKLSPRQGGGWTETVLHNFDFVGGLSDGLGPYSNLILDVAGNLYGTTSEGGNSSCNSRRGCGTVFELSPRDGGWTETVLHRFGVYLGDGQYGDGQFPFGGLILDSHGNLYGTTQHGGAYGGGAVFEIEH